MEHLNTPPALAAGSCSRSVVTDDIMVDDKTSKLVSSPKGFVWDCCCYCQGCQMVLDS